MPMSPQARLRDAVAEKLEISATCSAGHRYPIDLVALMDLAGPYAHLDQMLATSSWCPSCGALPQRLHFTWPGDGGTA